MVAGSKTQPTTSSFRRTVGVVIATYNQGDYLRQAVDSVLAQTRRPEQVIVIDDGSTDHSGEVLETLPTTVEVIRQENHGVVAARNRGLSMLHTTHVTFLDADDYLLPSFLRWTTAAWNIPHSRHLAVVYTPGRIHSSDGGHGYFHSRIWDPREIRRENYIVNMSLFSRAALIEVGAYSETFSRIGHEDWDLLLRLAERGWTGRMVPAPLCCYRQSDGSRNALSIEQHRSEVNEAIDALHPRDRFKPSSSWQRLGAKPLNFAQTILRNHDARSWLRS